jgi:hypothetical protein
MTLIPIPPPPSPEALLTSLRGTVQRLEQSENPAAVIFLKAFLIERIAVLETETQQKSTVSS